MATNFSSALLPSNSTDAMFRAWVQFIEDTLVSGGWVVTSDTGQMTISTAAFPTTTNQKVGYRVYRMDDALQATSPVFMRLDYGSSNQALTPGFWITIGQSTNGAGVFSAARFNGGSATTPTAATGGNAAVGSYNSYAAAGSSWFTFGLFVSITSLRILAVTLERSKDASGADTGDALILTYGTIGSSINKAQYVILGSAGQPPADSGLQYLLPSGNPGSFGADIGIGVHVPFAGIAQNPGVGIVVVRAADFAAEATFAMTLYGVAHTYQHLNIYNSIHGTSLGSDVWSRVCIRYE